MKIKDLKVGMIVWHNNDILGITGVTIPKELDNFEVTKVSGNYFDYEIVFKSKEERKQFNEIMKEKAIKEAIELLSKEGINSKQKAKELLEEVLKNDK